MDVSFQAVICPGVWGISPCFASLSDYQRAAFGFVGFVRLGPEMGPKDRATGVKLSKGSSPTHPSLSLDTFNATSSYRSFGILA